MSRFGRLSITTVSAANLEIPVGVRLIYYMYHLFVMKGKHPGFAIICYFFILLQPATVPLISVPYSAYFILIM